MDACIGQEMCRGKTNRMDKVSRAGLTMVTGVELTAAARLGLRRSWTSTGYGHGDDV